MSPKELIKGNSYFFGCKKGFQIPVVYVKETLNYRVFEDKSGTTISLAESVISNDITDVRL